MSFGTNELRNYVFLRSLLDVFEQRVLEYCSSDENPQVRFERILEIRDVITGEKKLPFEATGKYPDCDKGEHCEGMTCVPDLVISGWPDNDPKSWDT